MNNQFESKMGKLYVAYMGKGCSLRPDYISTIHGGHVGEGREHDYREVVGRATQEAKADDYREVGGRMKWKPESRSGSFEILRNRWLYRAPPLLTWLPRYCIF